MQSTMTNDEEDIPFHTMTKGKTIHHATNLRNHLHLRLNNLYRHQAHTDSQSGIDGLRTDWIISNRKGKGEHAFFCF